MTVNPEESSQEDDQEDYQGDFENGSEESLDPVLERISENLNLEKAEEMLKTFFTLGVDLTSSMKYMINSSEEKYDIMFDTFNTVENNKQYIIKRLGITSDNLFYDYDILYLNHNESEFYPDKKTETFLKKIIEIIKLNFNKNITDIAVRTGDEYVDITVKCDSIVVLIQFEYGEYFGQLNIKDNKWSYLVKNEE